MSNKTVSPQQQKIAEQYVNKYVNWSLKPTPMFTSDRKVAFESTSTLLHGTAPVGTRKAVWANHLHDHPDNTPQAPMFMWMTDDGVRKVGHIEAVPKKWGKDSPDTVYYVTGLYPDIVSIVRLWRGLNDLSRDWVAAQHAMASICQVRFGIEVLDANEPQTDDLKKKAHLCDLAEQHSSNVGIMFPCQNVIFMTDRAVGHKRLAEGKLLPVWTDDQARAEGLIQGEDKGWYMP